MPSSARSVMRDSRPGRCAEADFSRRPHIIGVRVSETTMETTTLMVRTRANSWNSRPTTPGMNSSGMKTATSETVNDTTVKPICAAPS